MSTTIQLQRGKANIHVVLRLQGWGRFVLDDPNDKLQKFSLTSKTNNHN